MGRSNRAAWARTAGALEAIPAATLSAGFPSVNASGRCEPMGDGVPTRSDPTIQPGGQVFPEGVRIDQPVSNSPSCFRAGGQGLQPPHRRRGIGAHAGQMSVKHTQPAIDIDTWLRQAKTHVGTRLAFQKSA